ncbi:DUF6455 family protein [Pseudodonghicola xiamenensis]|uniref:DUF6455 domain-containing protein n=1 Tax=Pseudodonghicola xiamenensis TaxID=337702 RepID=A0A8J3H8X9_9RHOB|nr:DUF6455 family protein [Pseudodonghicola xiamenensis]GHH01636.1 hypothetical protein GCM10010961_39020 [Pseudodonghicola xiamenensis]
MQDRDSLKRHAALVDRMAETLGIDLQEAALEGSVAMDEIADAVLRCTGCSDPSHCAGWLDGHGHGAAQTPGYCRNRDLMARLRPGVA